MVGSLSYCFGPNAYHVLHWCSKPLSQPGGAVSAPDGPLRRVEVGLHSARGVIGVKRITRSEKQSHFSKHSWNHSICRITDSAGVASSIRNTSPWERQGHRHGNGWRPLEIGGYTMGLGGSGVILMIFSQFLQ